MAHSDGPEVQRYVNPYTHPAHQSWVNSGHCSAIHMSKAWCAQFSGHSGDHRAPYSDAYGNVVSHLYWNDAENHSRPEPRREFDHISGRSE